MGEIDAASGSSVTTFQVEKWYEEAVNIKPVDISERIDAGLKSFSYKSNKSDPAGGVCNFIVDVVEALDQNSITNILKDGDIFKRFLKDLVTKLHPSQNVTTWSIEDNSVDIKCFTREISRLASEVSLKNIARERSASNNNRPRQRNSKTSQAESNKNSSSDNSKSDKTNRTNEKKRKRSDWNVTCMLPELDGIHQLIKCPMKPIKEKRDQLLKDYRGKKALEQKKQRTVKSIQVAAIDKNCVNEANDVFCCLLYLLKFLLLRLEIRVQILVSSMTKS